MAKKAKDIIVKAVMYSVVIIRALFLIPHGTCRYTPSCTAYAEEALRTLPLHKAAVAIVKRLLRCNPLSKGGYDPVYLFRKGKQVIASE